MDAPVPRKTTSRLEVDVGVAKMGIGIVKRGWEWVERGWGCGRSCEIYGARDSGKIAAFIARHVHRFLRNRC